MEEETINEAEKRGKWKSVRTYECTSFSLLFLAYLNIIIGLISYNFNTTIHYSFVIQIVPKIRENLSRYVYVNINVNIGSLGITYRDM
jgi:hypothetical protein